MKNTLLTICLILSSSVFAQNVSTSAFYVSPTGSDSNDGVTSNTPFQTLERAQKAAQESSIKTIYLRDGLYTRTTPLQLTAKDEGQSWLGYPGETPTLDGGNNTSEAITVVSSKNITVRWLKIQNFARIGIKAQNSTQLFFDSNTIMNIRSDGWNQGGIVLLNGIADALVSHNHVENSGYSGLMSANIPSDFRGLVRFEFNKILNTCLSVRDCGALYSDDRAHDPAKPMGVVMKNNIIGDFGDPDTGGRAIYLDDNQSFAIVTDNIIYGKGDWPIQIHGGDHNLIRNNIFDITKAGQLGLYQWSDQGKIPNYKMVENHFTCNIIYSTSLELNQVWEDRSGGNDMIKARGNMYFSVDKLFHKQNTLDKTMKAGFTNQLNLEQSNYQLTSETTPKFCEGEEFKLIDTSTVGPLPNSL